MRPCLPALEPIYGPDRNQNFRARSSAGEHYLDMVGVTGSIPVAPTILFKDLGALRPLVEGVVSTKAHICAGRRIQISPDDHALALGFQVLGGGCRSICPLPPRYSEGNAERCVLTFRHYLGRRDHVSVPHRARVMDFHISAQRQCHAKIVFRQPRSLRA